MDNELTALTVIFTEFYYWVTVVMMFLIHVGFFVVFLVWKFRMENAKYAAAVRKVRESGQMT